MKLPNPALTSPPTSMSRQSRSDMGKRRPRLMVLKCVWTLLALVPYAAKTVPFREGPRLGYVGQERQAFFRLVIYEPPVVY
jgi:hypothetical protein